MPDFPEHHSPGNWRPIIHETDSSSVSSSSENVSPKGAKFEEDPRTYSLKATRNVSPTFGDNNDAEWTDRFLDRELFVKDLPGWCRYHGKGGEYAHNTIRPAICEKIWTKCQGLCDAAQKLGKSAYLCDSHAQDPSHVHFIIGTHFPVETDDPIRPFRLNARGEFENPSRKAIADLFIGIMIAHGCHPDVATNLFYSSFGVVDVLPLLGGPGDPLPPVFFSSKKSGGKINSRTLKILVVIWSDHTSKILPRQFLISPPPQRQSHRGLNRCDHGRIFDPSRNGSANCREVKT
jgi:hypothetical protein